MVRNPARVTHRLRPVWLVSVAALVLAACTPAAPAAPTAAPAKPTEAAKPAEAPKPAGSPAVAASPGASPSPAASPAAAAKPTAAAKPAATVDFRGRTVRVIVGYNAGGGFDATARLLAPHLQAALEGNPTIVVENMAGADSQVAAKTVLTGQPRANEVSIVVYISSLLVKSVLSGGLDGFAPEKESIYLGKPDASAQLLSLCAHKSIVPNMEAFLNRSQPIKVGGLTGGSYYDMVLRWSKEVGLPIDIVFGYPATAQMILAFNQKEVDASPACRDIDLTQNPNWLENDEITPLFYWAEAAEALKKAQAEGKYPWYKHVLEVKQVTPEQRTVLQTLNEVNTGTNVYAVSQQTPPDVAAALQEAFRQAVTSQGFVNDMRGRQLSVGYRSSDDINATMATLERAPQSTRDFLRRTLGEP